jgi:hypothetical protein
LAEVVDPPTVNWLVYILGLFIALLAAVFEIYRRRIDKIQENHVTREELERYMQQIRVDRLAMHEENVKKLDNLHTDMNRVHTRIDEWIRAK